VSVVNMSHGVYWLCNREDDKFVPARMIKRACDKQFMAVCQRFGSTSSCETCQYAQPTAIPPIHAQGCLVPVAEEEAR